jgi:hypothetical protein
VGGLWLMDVPALLSEPLDAAFQFEDLFGDPVSARRASILESTRIVASREETDG